MSLDFMDLIDMAKERTSKLENIPIESSNQKQRLKIQGLKDNCKTCSICIMRILEEKGTDKYLKQ